MSKTPNNKPATDLDDINLVANRVDAALRGGNPNHALEVVRAYLRDMDRDPDPFFGIETSDEIPLSMMVDLDTRILESLDRRRFVYVGDLRRAKLSAEDIAAWPGMSIESAMALRDALESLLAAWRHWSIRRNSGLDESW